MNLLYTKRRIWPHYRTIHVIFSLSSFTSFVQQEIKYTSMQTCCVIITKLWYQFPIFAAVLLKQFSSLESSSS